MGQSLGKHGPTADFYQNVLKLLSSTVVAGLINSLGLLVMSRLYSPHDYGSFQVLLSIILLFGMVASLKYELASVLPEDRVDGNTLLVISFALTFLTFILFGLLFLILGGAILALLDAAFLESYVFLIPIGILAIGILQVARYVLILNKDFGRLARNKIYQALTQQSGAIVWGFFRASFIGLFVTYLAGVCLSVYLVMVKYVRVIQDYDLSRVRILLVRYKKFPMINTITVFANNFSIYMPVFLFSAFYDATTLGLYTMAHQYTVIPINLVSTSVSDVYYRTAAEYRNKGPAELKRVYLHTVGQMAVIGFIPLLAIYFLAPTVARLILDESWAQVGVYMQILSIGIYFRFVNIPIGSTFSIINRQEMALLLVLFSVVLRFSAMYAFREDLISMLWALSLSTAVFYAVYSLTVYLFLIHADKGTRQETQNRIPMDV